MTSPSASAVQELSIQYLSFSRMASYTQIPKEEISQRPLKEIIQKIVEIHNTAKSKSKGSTKPTFNPLNRSFGKMKNFKTRVFVKAKKGKTELIKSLENGEEKDLLSAGIELLLFFHRKNPVREIFAVTSSHAWHVVRPCINYQFPVQAVIRMLNPDRILSITRRCLIGPDAVETRTNPEGHEFYTTETLYYLVENFTCQARDNSSLMELGLFKAPPPIKVETGVLRILRKVPLQSYPSLLHLLSQHVRGEKTYDKEGQLETEDPAFEFLYYLQPADIDIDKLDDGLIKQIFDAYEKKHEHSVRLRHKYLNDFLYSNAYQIQSVPKGRYKALPQCPALEDILRFIEVENEKAFENEESFSKALRNVSLGYEKDSAVIRDPLISYLEGEVRYVDGSTYFKVRNMWYKLAVDHHALLHEDFRRLLSKILIEPKKAKELLPKPWIGNIPQGALTEKAVMAELKITKGIRAFMKKLKEAEVCYIDEGKIKQKCLIGEILKHPLIRKHKKLIEEQVLAKEPIPPSEDLKEFFGDDTDKVMEELGKKRKILDSKKFVINPFIYPLARLPALKDKRKQFSKFLAAKCLAGELSEDEHAYNRTYLYTEKNEGKPFGPEEGYLVFDRICPYQVEPGDIFPYNEEAVYSIQVKQDFGEAFCKACTQTLVAAKKFSSALRLNRPSDYLEQLWEMGTTAKEGNNFRYHVKVQLEVLGKENFFKIFRNRKLTFVIAILQKENQSLYSEASLPTRLTPECLKGYEFDVKEAFQALQQQQFIDSQGRLTGKFYVSTGEKFQLEGFESESAEIYSILLKYKPLSDSTLAKMELLRLAQEMRKLGLDFKLMEIEHQQTDFSSLQTHKTPLGAIEDFKEEREENYSAIGSSSYLSSSYIGKVDNGPIGMINVESTICYMLATLQMLFNIPEIRSLIESRKNAGNLLKELADLMQISTQPKDTEPVLRRLRKEVFKKAGGGELTGGEKTQQDAHEFLQLLLDQLKWLPINTSLCIKTKERIYTKNTSTSTNHLSIPLNKTTFQACLDEYFAFEEMVADGVQADPLTLTLKGGQEVKLDTWKQAIKLKNQPNYLIIHLVRFNKFGKIAKTIQFPSDGLVNIKVGEDAIPYEIAAFVNHIGKEANCGHYTADVKNYRDPAGQERWIHCDNDTLKIEEPNNPEKQAYLVMLKRKDNLNN